MTQNLRGAVRTLRSELAEWDSYKEQWQEPRVTEQEFRPDGKARETVYHNADGSISRYTFLYDDAGQLSETQFRLGDGPISRTAYHYDDQGRLARTIDVNEGGIQSESTAWTYDTGGRKTKVESLGGARPANTPTMFGIEGTETAYAADGVATITTLFDEHERSAEALLRGADGQLVLKVAFTRDEAGRLVEEEAHLEGSLPFTLDSPLEDAPADLTMAAKAIFKQILGSKPTTSRTTYRYDALGRRIERRASMFGMTENRTTWEYAEHDEPVRQTDEYVSREMNIDESGNRQPTEEKSARHEIRFDYKFDATGNWIERLVSFRTGANPEFQRSNIERRQVTYAPDPSLESLKDRGWREVAAINQAFAAGQIDDTAWHEAMAALVKPAYLAAENPYAQAGHSGDAASWEASRGFIAQALHRSGTFLDVGCANGILMESVHRWGTNKGLQIEPYGMDIVPEFVERARRRLPQWADRIYLGNIRTWRPVQDRFDFVLIRPEYAPSKREADMVRNILDHVLAPDGRLIVFVGAEEKEARLVESSIVSAGFSVAGRVEVPHSKDARVVRRLFWLDGFHA